MVDGQFYDLWNPPPLDERTDPFEGIDMDESKVQEAFQEIMERQKNCSHDDVQRWGPSYVPKHDGSYRKIDGYHCKDCGLSSDEPIGPYKKLPRP